MESFSELKSCWQVSERQDVPPIDDLLAGHKRAQKRSSIFVIILLSCISLVLFLILRFATIKMWSTYAGIILFMGLAFYSIYKRIRGRTRLSYLETLSNKDYLMALEVAENESCAGRSKQQAWLFTLWAVGFSLYIYEPTSQSLRSLMMGYGALAVYVVAVWFFYIPFMTRRNHRKIQKVLTHINHVKTQINDIS